MPKSRVIAPTESAALPAVATATLGRPFHLLPQFLRTLQAALADFIERELNARYHARFVVAQLLAISTPDDSLRRSWHQSARGHVAVHIERPLLLQILEYRYGGKRDAQNTVAPRETDTERRLARVLGQRLSQCLLQSLQRSDDALPAVDDLSYTPHPAPEWEAELLLADQEGTPQGRILLGLDDALLASVLQQLGGEAPNQTTPLSPPFAEQLRLTLCTRMLEMQLPLGDVLDLKVGSVLPVRLPPKADVLIGKRQVFAANVVERGGKLCLTSFQDLD